MLTLVLTCGLLATTFRLVASSSRRPVCDRDEASYLSLEINPVLHRAVMGVYQVQDKEMKWGSTSIYSMKQTKPETPLHLFGSNLMYFHGKNQEEIRFPPPMSISFENNFHGDEQKQIGRGIEGKVYLCAANFFSNSFAIKEVDQRNILVHQVHDESRSLRHYLKETPQFQKEARNIIFIQLMEGLTYIHKWGIAHRDIKHGNLLLEEDLSLQIIDFGIAKIKKLPNELFDAGYLGSKPYSAPEINEFYSQHNELVDIFSAGMVYFELFTPSQYKRKEKLDLLSNAIRKHAHEMGLLGSGLVSNSGFVPFYTFDLKDVMNGTSLLDGWMDGRPQITGTNARSCG